jgi:hypothetical protein
MTEAEADRRDGTITLSLYAPHPRGRARGIFMEESAPEPTPEAQLSIIVYTSSGFRAPPRVKTLTRTLPRFPLEGNLGNEDQQIDLIQSAIVEALRSTAG